MSLEQYAIYFLAWTALGLGAGSCIASLYNATHGRMSGDGAQISALYLIAGALLLSAAGGMS